MVNPVMLAVVRVLRQALEAGQLSSEQLMKFANDERWRSPLRGMNRTPENLAFKQTFDRLTQDFSTAEKQFVRTEALSLAQESLGKEVRVADARERTRAVIDVRLVPTPRSNGNSKSSVNGISIGWVRGRPVIGAKLHDSSGVMRRAHLFPFPAPPFNFRSSASANRSMWAQPPAYFLKGGVGHSFEMEFLKFENLEANENVSEKRFGFDSPEDYLAEESIVIQSGSGAKLFFCGDSKSMRFKSKLVMMDFERPENGPKVIFDGHTRTLVEHTVGGRKFLTFQGPHRSIGIYDIDGDHLHPMLPAQFGETNFSNRQIVLYEYEGRLKAAIAELKEKRNRIRIFDVQSNVEERTSPSVYYTAFGIFHFKLEGVPFLYFRDSDDLKVMNLQDLSVRAIPMAQFIPSVTGIVQINGKLYIPGVRGMSEMVLVDVESPGNVHTGAIATGSRESHIITFNDKMYAVVTAQDDLPQLVLISTLKTGGAE